MKHTSGPWKRLQGMIVGNLHKGERGTEGDVVCLMKGLVDYKNQDANARLIAAAPELLEACRFALLTIEHREGLRHRKDLFTDDERNILLTAIAKAEGRKP
jgi:hypothetical protein